MRSVRWQVRAGLPASAQRALPLLLLGTQRPLVPRRAALLCFAAPCLPPRHRPPALALAPCCVTLQEPRTRRPLFSHWASWHSTFSRLPALPPVCTLWSWPWLGGCWRRRGHEAGKSCSACCWRWPESRPCRRLPRPLRPPRPPAQTVSWRRHPRRRRRRSRSAGPQHAPPRRARKPPGRQLLKSRRAVNRSASERRASQAGEQGPGRAQPACCCCCCCCCGGGRPAGWPACSPLCRPPGLRLASFLFALPSATYGCPAVKDRCATLGQPGVRATLPLCCRRVLTLPPLRLCCASLRIAQEPGQPVRGEFGGGGGGGGRRR